jgi:hypothetical protein
MAVIGVGFFSVLALLGRPIFSDFGLYLKNVLIVGGGGFIAGCAFGLVLTALEHRKKLEDLSFLRIALWGGIGGVVLAAITGPTVGGSILGPIIVFTLMGIGSATGTVALAKRSDTKLIEGDDEELLALEGEKCIDR